jgi:hypothetical protein
LELGHHVLHRFKELLVSEVHDAVKLNVKAIDPVCGVAIRAHRLHVFAPFLPIFLLERHSGAEVPGDACAHVVGRA